MENTADKIRQKALEKFGPDEIDKFITMGKQLASKAVLSAVINILDDGVAKGYDKEMSIELIKSIKKILPYNYSGFVQCSFTEIPYLLNICLSSVGKTYKTDIDIPNASYAKDLFTKYEFLRKIAIAYWGQFREEHSILYASICKYRPDIDFDSLKVDKDNVTTLYFDPDSEHRIGIFAYYVDQNGQPFYKNSVKKQF